MAALVSPCGGPADGPGSKARARRARRRKLWLELKSRTFLPREQLLLFRTLPAVIRDSQRDSKESVDLEDADSPTFETRQVLEPDFLLSDHGYVCESVTAIGPDYLHTGGYCNIDVNWEEPVCDDLEDRIRQAQEHAEERASREAATLRTELDGTEFWDSVMNGEFGLGLKEVALSCLFLWVQNSGCYNLLVGLVFQRWCDIFCGRTDLDDPVVGLDCCTRCGALLDEDWSRGNALDWLCSSCGLILSDGNDADSNGRVDSGDDAGSGSRPPWAGLLDAMVEGAVMDVHLSDLELSRIRAARALKRLTLRLVSDGASSDADEEIARRLFDAGSDLLENEERFVVLLAEVCESLGIRINGF
jgi:hypothetical protein